MLNLKRCLPLLFCLTMLVGADAQTVPPDTAAGGSVECGNPLIRKAVREIMEQWKNGYNNGNARQVAGLYLENAYYLTQHFISGIVHGRSAIQAYVQRGIDARYQIDSIRLIFLECGDDISYAVTRYESVNAGQKAFGLNLVVLKKLHGKWYIAAHESAVPDTSSAIRQLNGTQ